jgi:hypothetical protein
MAARRAWTKFSSACHAILRRIIAVCASLAQAGGVGELRDSTAAMHDGAALRERMERDGYLLLRGLLDRPTVQAARLEVMTRLAERGVVSGDPSRGRVCHLDAPHMQ